MSTAAPLTPGVSRLHFYPFTAPQAASTNSKDQTRPASGRRRIITRQQGEALEMLSHAVDYLVDSYIAFGPVHELLVAGSPEMEAIGLLIEQRRQLLLGLPLAKPLSQRLWEWLTHRQGAPVVRLSTE